MCFNIAVKPMVTICRYIEQCFKTGSGGSDLDMEIIVRIMLKQDDTACESSERFECTICNDRSDNIPMRIRAVDGLFPEDVDDQEGGRNRTTFECNYSIIFSQNREPSNGDCDICQMQA